MNSRKDISIVVPVYNRRVLIKECIQSILEQAFTNWELLIIDDGSDDGTVGVVNSFVLADKRIKLIERKGQPNGAQHCRNIGLQSATSDYIIFLDSDDLLAPFCLSQRVAAIKADNKLDFVVFPQLIFYEKPGDSTQLINIKTNEPDINRFFTLGNCLDVPWINTGPVFKRSSLLQHSISWNTSLKGFHDVAFHLECLVAEMKYEFANCPPDFYYRMYKGERIGNAIFSDDTLQSTEKMILYFNGKIKDKNVVTPELKVKIKQTCFYSLIVKWIELKNFGEARSALKRIKKAGIISLVEYLKMSIYITSCTSLFKKWNAIRNKIYYRLWRESIYKRTPENYLKHHYSRSLSFPKISIITPSFNQGNYLEETILSVLNQNYPNFEYIIIDGGSTDNSIDIIKKYESSLEYWVSEKDRGQAHAINKGLSYCTGQIFNWINSDDYLEDGALLKVAVAFEKYPETDIVAGEVNNFDEKGVVEKVKNKKLKIEEYLKKDIELIYHQPGVWLRMDKMKETGFFKENMHYCFDQDYMMRYLLNHKNVCYIDDILANFRVHGNSKSVSQAEKFAWDFRLMYKDFWQSQKDNSLKQKAKRKYLEYEWPLLNGSINSGKKSRVSNFTNAVKAILKDPGYRLNRNSIGWLKHILMGKRNVKEDNNHFIKNDCL